MTTTDTPEPGTNQDRLASEHGRMNRKYAALLQTEFEAQAKSLTKSRIFTWLWFVTTVVSSCAYLYLYVLLND
ncbi:MAG: hypothetical protein OXI52_10290 [Caldilineaceae bacterium]|nr:hypothetical protein [Caldilineaceae bacterium]